MRKRSELVRLQASGEVERDDILDREGTWLAWAAGSDGPACEGGRGRACAVDVHLRGPSAWTRRTARDGQTERDMEEQKRTASWSLQPGAL